MVKWGRTKCSTTQVLHHLCAPLYKLMYQIYSIKEADNFRQFLRKPSRALIIHRYNCSHTKIISFFTTQNCTFQSFYFYQLRTLLVGWSWRPNFRTESVNYELNIAYWRWLVVLLAKGASIFSQLTFKYMLLLDEIWLAEGEWIAINNRTLPFSHCPSMLAGTGQIHHHPSY